MFNINQGFDLKSPQFNFKRDYFESVAALKAADLNGFPDHFITNVAGVLYQLTKSNSDDAVTGKWRKVELGSDVDLSGYVKKSEAIKSISFSSIGGIGGDTSSNLSIVKADLSVDTVPLKVAVASKSDGLLSAADKAKLDAIADGANKFTLEKATDKLLGGILTGYTNNGKNYKVELDTDGRAFVNVPWTDTKTDISDCAKKKEDNSFSGTNTFNGKTIFGDEVNVTADEGMHQLIAEGHGSTEVFAADGSFLTVEAISDDFINALS